MGAVFQRSLAHLIAQHSKTAP